MQACIGKHVLTSFIASCFPNAGTSKILTTIIDGEALLNDGSAIVIYEVLMELAMPGKSMTGKFTPSTLEDP